MILLTYLFTYLLRTTMSSVVINSDGSTGQGGFSYLFSPNKTKPFVGDDKLLLIVKLVNLLIFVFALLRYVVG